MFPIRSRRRLIAFSTTLLLIIFIIFNDAESASTAKRKIKDGKKKDNKSGISKDGNNVTTIRGARMWVGGPVSGGQGGGYTVNCYYCNIFMGGMPVGMTGGGGGSTTGVGGGGGGWGGGTGGGGWSKPPTGGIGKPPIGGGMWDGQGGEILNGRPATKGEFPYVVSFRKDNGDGTVGVCGGAIFDASHIITAAHCLFNEDKQKRQIYAGNDPSKITITAGTLDYWNQDRSGQSIIANHVCVHSSYGPDSLGNGFDIAIVKLSKPLDLSNPRWIKKAKILWTKTDNYGKRGTIAGWGVTLNAAGNDTVGTSRYLQTAEVFVYPPRNQCPSFDGDFSTIMCAGTSQQDIPNVPSGGRPTGTCGGDSGSPLGCSSGATKYDSCGLVSYTTDSCKTVNTLGKRTVFTKKAPYKAWVDGYVAGNRNNCFRSNSGPPADYPWYE